MKAALLAEGSSDQVLLHILEWGLDGLTDEDVVLEWVPPTVWRGAKRLSDKVARAQAAMGCDVYFIHRDADGADPVPRQKEIADAAGSLSHVPVVPVQTTEAWLLFDEPAIRGAAGRPRGRVALSLPGLGRMERMADPKSVLLEALRTASETTGRRRRGLDLFRARHRVAALVVDWSPLRELPSFRQLVEDTRTALRALGVEVHD